MKEQEEGIGYFVPVGGWVVGWGERTDVGFQN